MTRLDDPGTGAPQRYRDNRTADHLDDATVDAVGTVSEAFEWVERARGALYEFHQLSGHADQTLGTAIEQLENAGHHEQAELLRREVLGRNVVDGRWTFQLVEDYDDGYYQAFRGAEQAVRDQLAEGRRHVYEARMKATERRAAGRDLWGPGG